MAPLLNTQKSSADVVLEMTGSGRLKTRPEAVAGDTAVTLTAFGKPLRPLVVAVASPYVKRHRSRRLRVDLRVAYVALRALGSGSLN
jgi:hypothetical protein